MRFNFEQKTAAGSSLPAPLVFCTREARVEFVQF